MARQSSFKGSPWKLLLVFGGLTLVSVACGLFEKSESGSQVWDFSGPQLMGNGMREKTVSLTFDDGPGPRTAELSSFLKDVGVRATFFIQGSNAAQYPDVLQQLQQDGHLLANHSYSHPRMTQSNDPVDEVRRTDALIRPYVDQRHFLFRAPYGDWSGRVASILNSAGLTKYVGSVFWDIGGERNARSDGSLATAADWSCWAYGDSVARCLDGYLNEIRDLNRGIVLMHDVHSRTIDMAKLLVKELKQDGFDFIRADEAPSIVAALQRRTEGNDKNSPTLTEYACPTGFSATPVGQSGALMCLSEKEAQGPFTQSMQDFCRERGGGESCANSRWSRGMALWVHGTGRCPAGATLDSQLNVCVEGENAFGPFTQRQVALCKQLSSSTGLDVCAGNRWSRGFLADLVQR